MADVRSDSGVPLAAAFNSASGTPLYVDTSTGDLYAMVNGAVRKVPASLPGLSLTDNLVVPKTSGKGIQVDTAVPTFPWRDILGEPIIKTTGAAAPTMATYRGNIVQAQFSNAVTQELFNNYHVPHDYVAGTDIHIHIHWSQVTVDSGGAAGAPGQAKWYFDVTYSKGHNQAAFIDPITTSVTQTSSGTQYQHLLGEVQLSAASPSASQIDTDNIEPDGIIQVRTYRNPADPGDTLNQPPFVHFVDIHYQSTGIGTKQKEPDFYT